MAVFALVAGLVHLTLSLPGVYLTTSSIQIPLGVLHLAGWTYWLVAITHAWRAITLITHASKGCRFGFRAVCRAPSRHPSSVGQQEQNLKRIPRGPRLSLRLPHVRNWWERMFGIDGHFGVRGRYFSLYYLTLEVCQVLAQTYQCYQISRAVATPWINHLAVSIVVLNCLSTFLLSLVVKRESWWRVLALCVDIGGEFSSTIIVPCCVLYPLLSQFDWKAGAIPVKLLQDYAWSMRAVVESRQVLVVSVLDYICTVLPQFTFLFGVETLKDLLSRSQESTNSKRSGSLGSFMAQSLSVRSWRHGRLHAVVHYSGVVWAALVLTAHLHAQTRDSFVAPQCRVGLRPWLTQSLPCLVVEVNCHREQIDGSSVSSASVLAKYDPTYLGRLLFVHCPRLEIPTTLREVSALQSVILFNCTLIDWPAEAALTSARHPRMIATEFVATNLSTFPIGLLHAGIPPGLNILEFIRCNITTLPADIGEIWEKQVWVHFGIDSTPVRELPPSFHRLQLKGRLTLTDTALEGIPDEVLVNQSLNLLYLSGSPIRKLPSSAGNLATLRAVMLEHTQVEEPAQWLTTWRASKPLSTDLSMFGSPVCNDPTTELASRIREACTHEHHSRDGFIQYEYYASQHASDGIH